MICQDHLMFKRKLIINLLMNVAPILKTIFFLFFFWVFKMGFEIGFLWHFYMGFWWIWDEIFGGFRWFCDKGLTSSFFTSFDGILRAKVVFFDPKFLLIHQISTLIQFTGLPEPPCFKNQQFFSQNLLSHFLESLSS